MGKKSCKRTKRRPGFPTSKEWISMIRTYQEETDARKRDQLFQYMFRKSQPWIRGQIFRYCGHNLRRGTVSFEMLEQEARLALMKTLELFDTANRDSFFAYYKQWMRNFLIRYQSRELSGTVRRPYGARETALSKVKKGEDLTDAERVVLRDEYSFDEPIDEDNLINLPEMLLNESGRLPQQPHLIPHDLNQTLRPLLKRLSKDEREVIVRRFLQDQTLKEISQWRGCSRERIRQIQNEALRKMRQGVFVHQIENPL